MTAGRDRFAAVALEHLARAVASDELGVALREVRIRIQDARGALAVHVASPVAVPSLGAGTDTPLSERLSDARSSIRARMGALTGLEVGSVDIRATTAVVTERRVR